MKTKKVLNLLVVDDEKEIHDLFRDILGGESPPSLHRVDELAMRLFNDKPKPSASDYNDYSYHIHCCSQGDEAVALFRETSARGERFAVAFIDMRMPPGPDGLSTAEQIRELDPEVNIVFVTAYTDVDPYEISGRIRPADKFLFLHKPLHHHEIVQLARALTAKWVAERRLKELNLNLEREVAERTAEIADINTALKVLLKQRDDDMKRMDRLMEETDEKLLFNVQVMTSPSISSLKESGLNKRQMELVEIIENNLEEIVSPTMKRMSQKGVNFTASELNIANLIKQGKTTKEIAYILNLGTRTVEFHRANIRKKLELTHEKENLKSILLSMN
ncbi:MAG: LuxR C-terminal-related transcriptional regulator [Proteobacteria bacterium]|nr:LuxR C-terminal-related transcriptional regulator [Pseudomonadota bacterium]MBU1739362.1 LuxR C-terminal-related transcriptional regulator [Pseudomonadota bacterium]